MDVSRIIPLLLFLAALTYGGMKLRDGFNKLMATDVHSYENGNGVFPGGLTHSGFGQYLRAGKVVSEELAKSGLPHECDPYINSVENLDLLRYTEPTFTVTYNSLMQSPSGCTITDENVNAAEKTYLQQCFFTNPEKASKLGQDCINSIFALRATMTDMLLRNTHVSDIEDLGKLVDLLYSEAMRAQDGESQLRLRRVSEITAKILELSPSLRAAKRVDFFVRAENLIAETRGMSKVDANKAWYALEQDFNKAASMMSIDTGIEEYKVLVQTRGFDPSMLMTYANALTGSHPNDAWALFVMSFAQWKGGDHIEAFTNLKRAAEADRGNLVYQTALQKLSQPGMGEEAFYPGLKLGLPLQDFDK